MKYIKRLLPVVSLIIIVIPFSPAYAQDTIVTSPVFLKVRLKGAGTLKGYITNITDSTVVLVPKTEREKGLYDKTMIIPAERISVISGRKKGTVSKLEGAAGGLLVGSVIGVGIAYKLWDNNQSAFDDRDFFSSDEWKVGRYAGPVLGSIGLIAGFISEGKHKKKKFKIKGSRLNLKYKRFEILSE